MINWYAARLAWRQLTFKPSKMIAAIFGVTFAVVLVFMQLGFKSALFTSAARPPTGLMGDLFMLDGLADSVWRHYSFEKYKLARALSHPDVSSVTPVYIQQVLWRNPVTKEKRSLFAYGFDPTSNSVLPDQIAGYREELLLENHVLFDAESRPEFGPVAELLKNKNSLNVEVGDHAVQVVGLFKLGASFAADGSIISSIENFLRINPQRKSNMIDVGIIRLKNPKNSKKVKDDLSTFFGSEIQIMDKEELVEFEINSWKNRTPIGFVFGFGTLMGLIVGMVIVYQILFTDITNNLPQYATLKAMGYSNRYLSQNIFFISIFLAILGFIPGFIIAWGLYYLTFKATFLPIEMTWDRILLVFSFILAMCFISGSLAIRKLKAADPAEMF